MEPRPFPTQSAANVQLETDPAASANLGNFTGMSFYGAPPAPIQRQEVEMAANPELDGDMQRQELETEETTHISNNPGIQRQGYGVEDEEQMMSIWHDDSAGMTSSDAPMSIPTPVSSNSGLSSYQRAGMTSFDAPRSVSVPTKRNVIANSHSRVQSNSQSKEDEAASKAWKYTGIVNNGVSSGTALTQFLGDAAIVGTIRPGASKIADLFWNLPVTDDLIGLAGTADKYGSGIASPAGKFIGNLDKVSGSVGMAMGGLDAYNAYQQGDKGGIAQGGADFAANAIGFAGSLGGAFAGGYSFGQLLDRGVDWAGDLITGDEAVDHSISGFAGEWLYQNLKAGDVIPHTRKRGLQ